MKWKLYGLFSKYSFHPETSCVKTRRLKNCQNFYDFKMFLHKIDTFKVKISILTLKNLHFVSSFASFSSVKLNSEIPLWVVWQEQLSPALKTDISELGLFHRLRANHQVWKIKARPTQDCSELKRLPRWRRWANTWDLTEPCVSYHEGKSLLWSTFRHLEMSEVLRKSRL